MMSGTLRESRVRSNSLGKCPDPVKDTQIMEPVEVRDSLGIFKLRLKQLKYEHVALFCWSSSQQGKTMILETKQSVHSLTL